MARNWVLVFIVTANGNTSIWRVNMANEFHVGKKNNETVEEGFNKWRKSVVQFYTKYKKVIWIVAAVIVGLSFWGLGLQTTLTWVFICVIVWLCFVIFTPAVSWLYDSIKMTTKKGHERQGKIRLIKFAVVLSLLIAVGSASSYAMEHTAWGLAFQRNVFGYNDTTVTPFIYGDWQTSQDNLDQFLTPTPTPFDP
jgi:hypothetical protein